MVYCKTHIIYSNFVTDIPWYCMSPLILHALQLVLKGIKDHYLTRLSTLVLSENN